MLSLWDRSHQERAHRNNSWLTLSATLHCVGQPNSTYKKTTLTYTKPLSTPLSQPELYTHNVWRFGRERLSPVNPSPSLLPLSLSLSLSLYNTSHQKPSLCGPAGSTQQIRGSRLEPCGHIGHGPHPNPPTIWTPLKSDPEIMTLICRRGLRPREKRGVLPVSLSTSIAVPFPGVMVRARVNVGQIGADKVITDCPITSGLFYISPHTGL